MAKRQRGKFLTEREAAEQLGIQVSLISSWRKKGLLTAKKEAGVRGFFYDAQEIQRLKQIAQRLARIGVPTPVNVAIRHHIPVRWLTQLLGISRQRIYQLTPGPLSVENALSLLEQRAKGNPKLSQIYRTIRDLHQTGLL